MVRIVDMNVCACLSVCLSVCACLSDLYHDCDMYLPVYMCMCISVFCVFVSTYSYVFTCVCFMLYGIAYLIKESHCDTYLDYVYSISSFWL